MPTQRRRWHYPNRANATLHWVRGRRRISFADHGVDLTGWPRHGGRNHDGDPGTVLDPQAHASPPRPYEARPDGGGDVGATDVSTRHRGLCRIGEVEINRHRNVTRVQFLKGNGPGLGSPGRDPLDGELPGGGSGVVHADLPHPDGPA